MLGYILFFVILLTSKNVFPQEIISTAGEQNVSGNIQLSWSIGEPVTETFFASPIFLTQGFHQGNLKVTATEPVALPVFFVQVYPNPATSVLIINVLTIEKASFKYQLFSVEGKLLVSLKSENQSEILDMRKQTSGTYLLKISLKEQSLTQNFTIVKE